MSTRKYSVNQHLIETLLAWVKSGEIAIANCLYTQQEINIAVGKRAPARYMAAVLEQCNNKQPVYGGITDQDDLRNNLEENAIPLSIIENPSMEYYDFLNSRRQTMAATLKVYYRTL